MKRENLNPKSVPAPRRSILAFTLIELLVVIAIIAVLAGLLFTAMPAFARAKAMSTARAEITQIMSAIDAYKGKYGVYPPDSPLRGPVMTPLYYELIGMQVVNNGTAYRSLDGSYTIGTNAVVSAFAVPGLINSSASTGATDDRPAIESFLKNLKPAQVVSNSNVRLLACSADDTLIWRYNSSNPTNSPRTYDLWVDVVAGGKTNRVANWNVAR
ncbi:MAG TPA: type II secretion system protein [Verrucomicrobiae bacterium]|nr:type II secretion system protein [Verrucomicrobiae bacterium]